MSGEIIDQVELLSAESVGKYLVARGIIPDSDGVLARELGGGVSNIVISAHRGDLRVVVKQALPRLRVPDEWLAKRERALTEAEALRLAAEITPESVPRLLDVDRDACALTIEEAPETLVSWKSRLLAGDSDPAVAENLGQILGVWHAATFRCEDVARTFGDLEAFDQLRVDPYYRTVARRRPELAAAIDSFVSRMGASRVCLVHGDYSPKNVLAGERVWVLDFEVAHFGDPAFDLAFMLHHLFLKRLHLSQGDDSLECCMRAFLDAYCDTVPRELLPDTPYVLGHVGCLIAARVDGKSRVEYLSEHERRVARALGGSFVISPPATVDEAIRAAAEAAR
ncbi:MAG: phosphotransferase [Gaiellaceae bacterium]